MWLLRLLREEKCLEQLATGQRVLRVLASCLCFLEWMYRLLRAENLALQPEEHMGDKRHHLSSTNVKLVQVISLNKERIKKELEESTMHTH